MRRVFSRAPRRNAIGAFTNRGMRHTVGVYAFLLSLFLRLSALLEGKVKDPSGSLAWEGKEGV